MPNILTKKDKLYLETVLKPLHDNGITTDIFMKVLVKHSGGCSCILYRLNESASGSIFFKNGTMFKGMKYGKEYTFEDLQLFKTSKKEYAITLTEFWNSKCPSAIHCNTISKAKKLLSAFNKLGKTWRTRGEYNPKETYWLFFSSNTCYDNEGDIDYYKSYRDKDYTIYEFEDVNLDK